MSERLLGGSVLECELVQSKRVLIGVHYVIDYGIYDSVFEIVIFEDVAEYIGGAQGQDLHIPRIDVRVQINAVPIEKFYVERRRQDLLLAG